MSKQFLPLRRDSCFFYKRSARFIRAVLVRVIRGEQNALGSNHFKRALQAGLTPHATGRHVEILPETVGDRSMQTGHTPQRTEPLEIEENDFAPMAEDDLQIRILIEYP